MVTKSSEMKSCQVNNGQVPHVHLRKVDAWPVTFCYKVFIDGLPRVILSEYDSALVSMVSVLLLTKNKFDNLQWSNVRHEKDGEENAK